MLITTFNGGYGREGTIQCYVENCDKCGKEEFVIAIDSSDEEYCCGKICKNCILIAFEELDKDTEELIEKLSEVVDEKAYIKPIQCPVMRQFDHVDESFDVKRNDADINLNEQ